MAPYAELKSNEIEIEKLSKYLDVFANSILCVPYQQHEREVKRLFRQIHTCRRPLQKLRYIEILTNKLTKMDACKECTREIKYCDSCQLINQIRQKILRILTQSSTELLEQVLS